MEGGFHNINKVFNSSIGSHRHGNSYKILNLRHNDQRIMPLYATYDWFTVKAELRVVGVE
jgi:hypothetical protein